jgi:sulfane dehydrogenase subunit SoxC
MTRETRMDPSTSYRRAVPPEKLVGRITPSEDVYVIAHMGIAQVDPARWRLAIDGLVERPFALDHAALTALPAIDLTSVLECFGNPLEPDVPTRRAANVAWRGTPLADLLRRAGIAHGARLVWAEGLDHGTFAGTSSDRYIKDLPLARALEPDVLIAWQMNGQPLTAEHGFPARLLVPGYFGTNSVKWLTRLTVATARPDNLFTTQLYNRPVTTDGNTAMQPARELDVQSIIISPGPDARLQRGWNEIVGWAWSATDVRTVDVSIDGGTTWQPAELGARPRSGHDWQPFKHAFGLSAPGRYDLQARATDADGRTQSHSGRNAIHRVLVTVE